MSKANSHEAQAQRIQFLEQQLAEYQSREEDLVLLLENSPEKVASLDTSLLPVVVSRSFMKCFQLVFGGKFHPDTDFLGLLDKKGREFWAPHLQKALEGERQVTHISQQLEGRYVIYEVTFQPLRREKQMHRILVFCHDITAQRRAEAEVQEHAVNLSNALRIAGAGSWEFDVPTQIITISEEALSIIGIHDLPELVISLEEFIERFLHPDDVGLLRERLEYALTRLDDPTFQDMLEYRLIDVHGNVLDLVLHSRYKSNATGVIYGVTQDITEQKAILSQLELQNEQLKKVNSELDNFVYSVSHDLRAPLASVLGLVNLMRLEEDPAQLREYLNLQEESVQKLDFFIRDIMDLSRNARLAPQYEAINIAAVIQEVFKQQSYDSRAKQIERQTHIQATTAIVTDRNRVMIILNNLVSNAIRYADLSKTDARVMVRVEADARQIMVQVCDNGIGVEARYLSKIYDMFFRASEARSGSGLGLYIVKETVDKLGGTIQVESELGKGTCFTVSLPNHV